MASRILPSKDILWELLHYDPIGGELRWNRRTGERRRIGRHNALFAGNIAGNIGSNGYIVLEMQGRPTLAHRIIFKMMTGLDPTIIDHIDRDRTNNRWANLREVTHKQNQANRCARKGRTLPKGVGRHRDRFRAFITIDGAYVHLGTFDTPQEAASHYHMAARNYFGASYFAP